MFLRSEWVDVSKGAAISLVVFGHAWRGLYNKGLIEESVYRALDSLIYAFHMPLFFLISGFFFFNVFQRGPFGVQIVGATRRLLIPMVLWTYIFLTLRWGFSDFTNTRPDYTSLFVLPVPGILHFWFLWALWAIQVFYLVVAALVPFRTKGGSFTTVAFGLAIGIWLLAPYLPFQEVLKQAYDHVVFFAAGAFIYKMLNITRINWFTLLPAAFLFFVLIPLTQQSGSSRIFGTLLALGMSVSFLIIVKWLSERAPKSLTPLKWAGIFSFAIYMMHTIFSAGIRELLLSFGVTSLGVHLFLGCALGIVAPVAASIVLANTRISGLLGMRPGSIQVFGRNEDAKT